MDRLNREEIQGKFRGTKPPSGITEEIIPEEEPQAASDEPKFFIRWIKLIGSETFPPEEFSPMIEKYLKQELTLTDLQVLSREIEREYIKRGVLAAVFVPPQEIRDQTAFLQVVEAKMGRLEIQDHKWFSKNRLKYYWDIEPGEVLRYEKMSHALQVMNKNPDRDVKSILRAGKEQGTTDVILEPKTNFPVHIFSTFDREGTPSTGRARLNSGIRHNNFLGLDDTMIIGYTYGAHFAGKYAYHSVPISPVGTSLTYGYSAIKSVPKKDFAQFGIYSDAENSSVSLHQDFYTKEDYLGELYFGFDAKDKRIRTNSGVFNKDRLRIFNIGGSAILRGSMSNTSVSAEFDRGVEHFGASKKGNPLASRGGNASPIFSKFNFTLQHARALPFDMQTNIKLRRQFTYDILTPQEEFNLGGLDSVRGYPPADFLADNAEIANWEILIPPYFIPPSWRIPYEANTLRKQLQFVAFADYGHGSRKWPSANEKKAVDYIGVGGGVRMNVFNQALLRLEWGVPVGTKPLTEEGATRFHFSVDFQEKLPEELERVMKEIEKENIKEWAMKLVNEELSRPDSFARYKLYTYIIEAEKAYKRRDYAKAKNIYEDAIQLARSLYRQAEEYVRTCIAQEKEIKAKLKFAQESYRLGDFNQARVLWQEVINESMMKPAIFEF